jgi:hypothetical protein
MNKPVIVYRDGTEKTVTNLGWLLSHAGEVRSLTLVEQKEGACHLLARLNTCDYYAQCASLSVMTRWCNRPVFKGLYLTTHYLDGQVGTTLI